MLDGVRLGEGTVIKLIWSFAEPNLKLRHDDLCDVSIHGALHSVTKLDETVLELLGRPQRQWDVTVTSRYKWNTISYKYWNDTNDELVDRLRIKKRGQ